LAPQDDWLAATTPLAARTAWRTRGYERTGRPLGDRGFVAGLKRRLGKLLAPRKPGPSRAMDV